MRPELLAPAGSPEALRAAVQNGADAVYLGWGAFNARRGAKNFSDEEFAAALAYCHERGVRVFLTLNTLVTDRELPQALETAVQAGRLGVDAVLVQDWGLFGLLRRTLPDLPLHASTQMSLFTSGGAREIAADGCERVVIARECSAEDTRTICENCPVEVEVFAHGALCMCYSGQCEMSALIGGRSGNRGRCAQPCRLPYGVNAPAKKAYPLSLKDSCLAGRLEEMGAMGVSCVKLEGRMKRPEYVAVITRIYARLLEEGRGPTADERAELEQAFSRSGFTDWYWQGKHGAAMFGTRPENAPDPKDLFEEARRAYERDSLRTVPVDLSCSVSAGVPCTLTVSDRDGHSVTVTGPVPEEAVNVPLTREKVEGQLSRTGGTPFSCEKVTVHVDEGLSLPLSALNALRRQALEELGRQRTALPERRCEPFRPGVRYENRKQPPVYTLSVRAAEQVSPELLRLAPALLYLPAGEGAAHPEVVEQAQKAGVRVAALLPRICTDREAPALFQELERLRAMGVTDALAGTLDSARRAAELGFTLRGDYGLGVFNGQTLKELKRLGFRSATLSFELKLAQIRDLSKGLDTELVVYGRLPLMITENCIIHNHSGRHTCANVNLLTDRKGERFPVVKAPGCRNEILNSKKLFLADKAGDWQRLGLWAGRLMFTTENARECVQVLERYLGRGSYQPNDYTRGLYYRGVE